MPDSDSPANAGEEKDYYRKVLEWRISNEMEEEEDSAYASLSLSQLELSSSDCNKSNELSKMKVPPLQLIPGEKCDCSISSILSPLRFRLRRNDEEFYKLTRLGGVSLMWSVMWCSIERFFF